MQIRNFHEGRFLSDHTNVIIVGGTGTGKTHLAISIARQTIRNGRKARFFNMLDLVNQLEQEKLDNRGGKLRNNWHDMIWSFWMNLAICHSQRLEVSFCFI